MTETWLKEDEAPLFQLPNYKFVTKCRNGRRGGGVGIYVRSDLQFHKRTDLEASICGTEVLCIIKRHHKKTNHLYFVMYRPPVKEFLNSIESSLHKVQTEKKNALFLVTSTLIYLIQVHPPKIFLILYIHTPFVR